MFDQKAFEKKHNVKVMSKKDSLFMRFIGFVFSLVGNQTFMTRFWTTYRLPFQKCARITYPTYRKNPFDYNGIKILEHELYHVEQLKHWYGPLWMTVMYVLFPLPVIFSGRWYVERYAYLHDIKSGRMTIDQVVNVLWREYGWCWPKPLMRKWFNAKIKLIDSLELM